MYMCVCVCVCARALARICSYDVRMTLLAPKQFGQIIITVVMLKCSATGCYSVVYQDMKLEFEMLHINIVCNLLT